MNICVAIPVYNEAARIARIVAAVKEKGLDVLVIDDGSTDDSGRLAQEAGAVVVRNDGKKGKGFSLQKAFARVLEQNYDGVITMDGDGQHDVESLPLFMEKIIAQPHGIIAGTRMNNSQTMPLLRLVTNRLMSLLISVICKQAIADTQCGYRYISRDVLKRLRLTSHDFEIETEVLIKASKMGYKISSVSVKTIYRNEKSKINPFKDTIRFFVYLVKEMTSPHER